MPDIWSPRTQIPNLSAEIDPMISSHHYQGQWQSSMMVVVDDTTDADSEAVDIQEKESGLQVPE
jgi:hypothetical protein